MARLQHTTKAVRSILALAAEHDAAGATSAAYALREAAILTNAARHRDEKVLTAEANRLRALIRAAKE